MARTIPGNEAVTFEEQLRLALTHFHDPAWLAEHSPLAAAYWAGQPPTESGAGAWLQHVLYEGAVSLWGGEMPQERDALLAAVNKERAEQGKGQRYAFLVLEMHYFQRHFQIPKQNFIWEDYLFIGKSQYYRDLEAAVRLLGQRLLERLRPSFRPERPKTPASFTGREETMAAAGAALATNQSVALSGASGIGKSAVGMCIAETWSGGPVFWYTVRAGYNDQVQGLLLALGYFLHEAGSSSLWRQVVAGKGQVENLNLALGLAHHDLTQLSPRRPLLCFDDIDRLRPADFSESSAAHEQMLDLLRGLHGYAPVLLIGQRAVAEADVYLSVEGLSDEAIEAWLRVLNIAHTPDERTRLLAYTGGNPRLLRLCVALTRNGATLTSVLDALPSVPVLQSIFRRLWQGLSQQEQALVQRLSVFITPAPADAFSAHGQALAHLQALGIVEQESDGSVTLVPVIGDVMYTALSTELRDQHHQQAAAVYGERGLYTDAAYHYGRAGEATRAVELWFEHREVEILSGRAAHALSVFRELSARRLEPSAQEKLALIRSELHRFAGETDEALTALRNQEWAEDSEVAADAMLLEGRLQQGIGQHEAALETYGEGLAATTRLLRQRVALQVGRGIAYIRQKDVQAAWREAALARYEVEHLQGVVQEAMGKYSTARTHFTVALMLAEEANFEQGAARTHYQLAGLAGRQLDTERAIRHLDFAIRHYESVGDLFTLECVRTNLAAVKIQAKAYAEAIDMAGTALHFFQRIRHPYWVRVAATTLSEACYEAGRLDEAEEAAQIVLTRSDPQHHAYALVTMGHIRRQRCEVDAAIDCYQKAINIAAANEDIYIEAYAWRGLGGAYLDALQHELEHTALTKSVALFRQLQMNSEAEAVEQSIKIAG